MCPPGRRGGGCRRGGGGGPGGKGGGGRRVGGAEAGVIAGVRARALREPAESRLEALRRFSQERQVTLSSLALARNLALVGITALVVFLGLEEAGQRWAALD